MIHYTKKLIVSLWLASLMGPAMAQSPNQADVVVVGATPGGICAAIGAARLGKSVILLDRNAHIGGLPANGLGATDIATPGVTGGLFAEFVQRNYAYYVSKYGAGAPQTAISNKGYHFEPSVAENTFHEMLRAYPGIRVLTLRQFDALPANITMDNGFIKELRLLNRQTGQQESYTGSMFIDATYEGDLAAAAGAPFRTRRESKAEYKEPLAGKVYIYWEAAEPGEGSTFEGDTVIQAYNYRLCLTDDTTNLAPVTQPPGYSRDEFVSLIADVRSGFLKGFMAKASGIVNPVALPNRKTDSNNHHGGLLSTDLPEENWPWPKADWAWRDSFAVRLKHYTLGLLYFCQNDTALPQWFREDCKRYGFAKDEYTDNGYFPRQVYVREGRRIEGEYLFTGRDALPVRTGERPPVHEGSITASHYAIDSHGTRKREKDRVHLDGFLSVPTEPYTVPIGVILPRNVHNLFTPVPVSATHLGFGTLRMEPCWMAMGQAAGITAAQAIDQKVSAPKADRVKVQQELLKQQAILYYYRDCDHTHPNFAALQFFGLRGLITSWYAHPYTLVTPKELKKWNRQLGLTGTSPIYQPGITRRGELMQWYYDNLSLVANKK